ncbi:MAG: 16S rRNA (adenine(1518)-N(6)/adenine(1519)-N(6))-dimethyltransferase RsmA [Pseudomonadales bacterium]|nr:16S rRNA (adenine(1518)-N(6)/adenine(1519)-N(6))-dimethyltransferase RsmA [Pseudomonadales bacterium]MCP5185421.1 16S rRNA (adenine(1518)-N(6)/adenine(1519)-N(6))-dimethyltransferase RsmA [Pseudomonadales bacterium]
MKARKRFGQHFLVAEDVIGDIVSALGHIADDHVIEIGPGHGALTASLAAAQPALLTLVEIDRDLAPRLAVRFPRARVLNQDVLTLDFASLAPRPYRVVGNLPYNISTPLLVKLLRDTTPIADMHFMLQREVADRLAAGPGSKAWGRLSVLTQYHCTVEKLFDVAPECFEPPPAVVSAVVRLVPRREQPDRVDSASLDAVLRALFSQRRKRIASGLRQLAPMAAWEAAGLDLDTGVRVESVSLDDFLRLAAIHRTLRGEHE